MFCGGFFSAVKVALTVALTAAMALEQPFIESTAKEVEPSVAALSYVGRAAAGRVERAGGWVGGWFGWRGSGHKPNGAVCGKMRGAPAAAVAAAGGGGGLVRHRVEGGVGRGSGRAAFSCALAAGCQ